MSVVDIKGVRNCWFESSPLPG